MSKRDELKKQGKSYETPHLKKYSSPKLTSFGDLRDVSKGQAAYSAEEGAYQEFAPS